MRLSAEQFAELAASFATNAPVGKHDRRRAARRALQARIRITPIYAGRRLETISVAVSDFSARGVAFIQEEPMTLGQQFITELPRTSGGSIQLLCTVMNARPISHNHYRIGAEFTCAVQPSQTSAMPDSAGQECEDREATRIRQTMLD